MNPRTARVGELRNIDAERDVILALNRQAMRRAPARQKMLDRRLYTTNLYSGLFNRDGETGQRYGST